MDQTIAIEARGLTKRYNDRSVVSGLNLEIAFGECFGLLGPNGAGKSTTLKMMYGSVLYDQGDLYVLGLNAKNSRREIKSRIGIVPQEDGLEIDFTVRENLDLYGRFHGLDRDSLTHRIEDLLKSTRLEEYADQYVTTLSGGFKRRLCIARALINNPRLLFLDEPTTGLDPQARMWIWNLLKELKGQMNTVVLSTHYMEEAEKICDRIAMIDNGKILAVGKPKDLVDELIGRQVLEFQVTENDVQYYVSRLRSHHFKFQVFGSQVNIHLQDEDDPKKAMNLIQGLKVSLRQSNLSDVFFKLSGHDLRSEPL
jgi:lipooligosaccharide transport system ATP-binding protein